MNIASYVNSIHSIYAVGIDIEPFIVTIDKAGGPDKFTGSGNSGETDWAIIMYITDADGDCVRTDAPAAV